MTAETSPIPKQRGGEHESTEQVEQTPREQLETFLEERGVFQPAVVGGLRNPVVTAIDDTLLSLLISAEEEDIHRSSQQDFVGSALIHSKVVERSSQTISGYVDTVDAFNKEVLPSFFTAASKEGGDYSFTVRMAVGDIAYHLTDIVEQRVGAGRTDLTLFVPGNRLDTRDSEMSASGFQVYSLSEVTKRGQNTQPTDARIKRLQHMQGWPRGRYHRR